MRMRRPSIDIEALPLSSDMATKLTGLDATETVFLTTWPNGSQLAMTKSDLDKEGFFEVKRRRKKQEMKGKRKATAVSEEGGQ